MDAAWVALSLIPSLGRRKMRALIAHFGNTQAVLKASADELTQVYGIGATIAAAIGAIRLDAIATEMEKWQQAGVRIVPLMSDDYPLPLAMLDDAPPTLFVRGELSQGLWTDAVAIVGTRQPSDRARGITCALSARYAQKGYTVVSGLAMGIDGQAHQCAISQNGGRTVAVLGNGILRPYPEQHTTLAERILEKGGTILCECAPVAGVHPQRLVARNRLITGLSRLILLIESTENGGAMHAIRFARQQEKHIYVVDLPASGNQQAIHEGTDGVLTL